MSDQQKLSESLKKWSEQEGPVYFARDQAAMWKTQAEALETQLAEAQAERDALAKAFDGFDCWKELSKRRDTDECDNNPSDAFEQGARIAIERFRDALAALERPKESV